jgi:hypothetical protein
MSRGLNTRIRKLEAARHSDGEILLLWRKPGMDVATVAKANKSEGLFASGDRVISAEWLGTDPVPAPRWVKVGPSGSPSFNEREDEYCMSALRNLIGNRAYDPCRGPALGSWTDADLWHRALGIKT